jgi:ankyrin repeat protein
MYGAPLKSCDENILIKVPQSMRRIQTICLAIAFLLGARFAFASEAAGENSALELKQLIRSADHAVLEDRLNAGLDPNSRLPDGSLPLAWAVEMQDAISVRLLLTNGATPNDDEENSNAFQPLIIACLYGNAEILDLLLENRVDVNAMWAGDIPALSICAGNAPQRVVEQMIKAGADPRQVDSRGQTPLMWAALNGRVENINLLVRLGADANRQTLEGFTPVFFAVKSRRLKAAEAIIEGGGDLDYALPDGTSIVQLAMYQQNYDFAAFMVRRGVDLQRYDSNGRQLLHAAVLADQLDLVSLLISQGADVNAVTKPSSVQWRYESNFKAGDYDFPLIPPLLLAAQQGQAEMLSLLALAGADTGFITPQGDDVLLVAAASGSPKTLGVALQLNSDVNKANGRGDTPLHKVLTSSTGKELEEMLRMLAQRNARADIENKQGITADAIGGDEHFKSRETFVTLYAISSEQSI